MKMTKIKKTSCNSSHLATRFRNFLVSPSLNKNHNDFRANSPVEGKTYLLVKEKADLILSTYNNDHGFSHPIQTLISAEELSLTLARNNKCNKYIKTMK